MNSLMLVWMIFSAAVTLLLGLTGWTFWEHRYDVGLDRLWQQLQHFIRRDPWHGSNTEHFLPNWMRLSLYPDFIIGGPRRPYLRRWYVLPRAPWPIWPMGAYLHQIMRSDDERALHNHPWPNISILLRGSYDEVVPERPHGFQEWMTPHVQHLHLQRHAGDIVCRRSGASHRLVIPDNKPVWSLFIVGPRIRQWGFWCQKGFVHWRDFVATTDRGSVGRGCD